MPATPSSVAVDEVAGDGDGDARRDDRDDDAQRHELVAVEVEQRGEEAEHRQQTPTSDVQQDVGDACVTARHYRIFSEIIHSSPLRRRALEADGVAGRQRHVVPVQDAEAQVDLRAQALIIRCAATRLRGIGPQRRWRTPRAAASSGRSAGVPTDSNTTGGRFHSTISRDEALAADLVDARSPASSRIRGSA